MDYDPTKYDYNLSREVMVRLAEARPFRKFVTFPIVLSDEIIRASFSSKSDIYYTYPKDGDFTESIKVNDYIELSQDVIDHVERVLKPKETYISPFTGKVT